MNGKAARKLKAKSSKPKSSTADFPRRYAFEPEPGQIGMGPDQLREIGEIELEENDEPQGMVSELLSLMNRLKARRVSLNLSLTDVSERSGLTRQAVSKLENNRTINPTVGTLFRYTMALDAEIRFGIEEIEAEGN